jgi:WD40 repeat protein
MARALTSILAVLVLTWMAWGQTTFHTQPAALVPGANPQGFARDPVQPSPRNEVTGIVFLPDGKSAVAACLDEKLHVYDVATRKERFAVDAHKDGVWAIALSPDGKYLATGGGDQLVRLWDTDKFKEIRSYEGQSKEVTSVAFSPDGQSLASGGADGSIRIWDKASGKKTASWQAHELKVLSLGYSPDGKTLASGGTCIAVIAGVARGSIHADHIRLWDPKTGKELRQHTMKGSSVSWSPDGRTLLAAGNYVTGSQENGVTYRASGSKATLGPPGKNAEWSEIKGVGSIAAFSADGRLIALAYGNRLHTAGMAKYRYYENEQKHHRISIWEAATGQEVLQIPEDDACSVAISPDGKKLAAGFTHSQVQFWDLKPEGWKFGDKAVTLDAKDLDQCWADLSSDDAKAAYQAICTLAAAGEPAVVFLKGKLEPVKPAGDELKRLLAQLDSEKYADREGAFRELKKLAPAVEGELRQALDGKISPEVRKRLEKLLEAWEKRPASPDELRSVRAIQTLEQIGSPAARAMLTQLSEGAPGAWITTQAKLAAGRVR